MTIQFLVIGASSGIGAGILFHLNKHLSPSTFAAASSNPASESRFTDRGIAFRHADYNDPATLETAFRGVQNLLFVSSPTFDNELRSRQHQNVIEAAKKAGVGHVWYTSLAFGGFGDESGAGVMAAHLETERMLRESGIVYTSVREGIYTEAFPVFMAWYPSTKTVYLPNNAAIAWTSRAELAEATARLMIKGGHEKQKVLLTAQKPYKFNELVDIINETTNRNVKLEIVSEDEFVARNRDDEGGKPEAFFRNLASWFRDLEKGLGSIMDPLMEELLGRKPKDAKEAVAELLNENRDYTWHQNYLKG